MIRSCCLVGAIVSLIGALGFVLYGHALSGVFAALTYRAGAPLPAAFDGLPWVVNSAATLVGGVIVWSFGALGRSAQSASPIEKWLRIGAGICLLVAAIVMALSLLELAVAANAVAMADATPTVEEEQAVIQNAAPKMKIAGGLLVAFSVLLLAAAIAAFRTGSTGNGSAATSQLVIASIVVGLVLALLTWRFGSSGASLQRTIADAVGSGAEPDHPELVTHFVGVLRGALAFSIGLAVLGGLQILASALLRTSRGSEAA